MSLHGWGQTTYTRVHQRALGVVRVCVLDVWGEVTCVWPSHSTGKHIIRMAYGPLSACSGILHLSRTSDNRWPQSHRKPNSRSHSFFKNSLGEIHGLSPWRLVDYWTWTKTPDFTDFVVR